VIVYLDTPSQGGLRIAGQLVCVEQYNTFEKLPSCRIYIGFAKELQFLPHEFYSFAMPAVYFHDVTGRADLFVDPFQEGMKDCFFPSSRRTVENNVRNYLICQKNVQLCFDVVMHC
jgi:hypothetical protein